VMRRFLATLLLVPALTGCMKVREELLVMPDGSGRISLTFSVATKGEAGKFTEAELMAGDPDEIQDKVRGLVAMTRPTLTEKEGVVQIRMTGYFDDINALKFMDDGEGAKAKPKQDFVFHRDGEGYALELRGNLLADDSPDRGGDDPELAKAREDMIKVMFAGFEFRQDVTLPGTVLGVEGFGFKEGRVATYAVGEKDLQKTADLAKLNRLNRFKASCGKSEVTDSEAADFRRELERAKAGWDELRKELKKKAEKK